MEQSDEIDLLDLAIKFYRGLLKNLRFLIYSIAIGLVVGLSYYLIKPKVYQDSMMLNSDLLTFPACRVLVEDLNKLVKENNYKELKKRLGIDSAEVKNIFEFLCEDLTEKTLDNKEKPTIFVVRIKFKSKVQLEKLQASVLNYFKTNEFSKSKEKERKLFYQGMIDQTTFELSELERLRVMFLEGKLYSGLEGKTILFDPTTINSRILDLTREKLNNQIKLSAIDTIQLIQGFTNFTKPIGPSLLRNIGGGAIVGLLLALMSLAYKAFKRAEQSVDIKS
jgi:hypothetical protein